MVAVISYGSYGGGNTYNGNYGGNNHDDFNGYGCFNDYDNRSGGCL